MNRRNFMSNIKPLYNRVLVRLQKAAESKGSILLPESAKEKSKQGEIVATGPGVTDNKGNLIPMTVQPGDKILFSTYAGNATNENDEEIIISEDDILAVIQ
jgi:chaperonin GroES